MPAVSKAQQKAAGAALSAKRGETPRSALKGASAEMLRSMSETDLEHLAETPRGPLPEHKEHVRGKKKSHGAKAAVATAKSNEHLLPSRRTPRG